MPDRARRVFISHTSEMYRFPQSRSFVAAAMDAVARAGDVAAVVEDFAPESTSPLDLSRRRILESDVFVGILGFRYGARAPGSALSYVELEFQAAAEAGIPRLMFLLDENALIPASMAIDDPDSLRRQNQFREHVLRELIVHRFDTPDGLETGLLQALVSLQAPTSPEELGQQRSVLILCFPSARELGMRLARELAPDASTTVWPLSSALVVEPPSAGRLRQQLDNADLALVILGGEVSADGQPSMRTWFDIGMVVGALGGERLVVLAPGNAFPEFVRELGMSTQAIDSSHPDPITMRAVVARIRSQLLATSRRSHTQPASYSCFLSYAAADREFVERIYVDLQDAGISCWLDQADIPVGSRWDQELYHSLAVQDKVLVVLSRHSVQSRWVQSEVARAVELERERHRAVLFPIRIDGAVFETDSGWARDLTSRQIGDFANWGDNDSYRRSLRRLVRDLTISSAGGASREEAHDAP